jgi:hypothetical protein
MQNKINPELIKDKALLKQHIESQNELDKKKIDRGWLGNFWGISESIPNNIAALLILLLLLTGIIYSFFSVNVSQEKLPISIKDFWAIISPLITLAIGYLFGHKPKEDKNN